MEIAVLLGTIIILSGVIVYIELHSPKLSGDFSSFDRWCPVKGCGWSFQTDEDFAAHIVKNKHGVDIT